ncbi:large ribosomal subunit protein eL39 isoform X1 [Pagrus major]|uniref:large ribosomal subunit protein eL39 isoform X1 n=1 Tax=Pagrus major TaxID=143350 RepID=UPI003CC85B26
MLAVVPQDFQDQALPRQEAEAEQAHSSVDQDENWQQDQVQLQEETLEEDQARPVNARICGSQRPSIPTSARTSSCWA